MRTLVRLVATISLTTFAVASAAATAPAAGGGGSSAGAASSGGGFSGGSGGGGSGGGGSHGSGSGGGGGGAHGGGGGYGGGAHSGGGYSGGGHSGGGHWSGSNGGVRSGSGHWTGGAGQAGSASRGGNESQVNFARGSYVTRGTNGARGGYGIVGSQSAGLIHAGAAPSADHAVRTALALGPTTGSAATAARVRPPGNQPNKPHHYRASNYPYPTSNSCESAPCQWEPRGLWQECNPLAADHYYDDNIGCPEAIKVRAPIHR